MHILVTIYILKTIIFVILPIVVWPHFLDVEKKRELLGRVVDPENVVRGVEQQLLLHHLHGCVRSVSRPEESPGQDRIYSRNYTLIKK
jgi:hypothetical protein